MNKYDHLCELLHATKPETVARLLEVSTKTVNRWADGRGVPRDYYILKAEKIKAKRSQKPKRNPNYPTQGGYHG